MDASFKVASRESGGCTVIQLAGELDMAAAPHLAAVIDQMMVIPDHILVDMSQLTFIDSTGLGLLVRASKLVGGRIWLNGLSPHVLRVLNLTGTAELFCLEDHTPAHTNRDGRVAGLPSTLPETVEKIYANV